MSKDIKEQIGKLCSVHMRGQDPDKMSEVLEALSSSLAFTISIASGGNKEAIETLVTGVEHYVLNEAIRLGPVGKLSSLKSGGNSQ